MDNNVYNYLQKNKGPAILHFNGAKKIEPPFFKLIYDDINHVEKMFERLLTSDLKISTKVIGKTLYVWEKKK